MNYLDIDPYPMIRQRNQEVLQEVQALRLEKRLQANREPRASQLGALIQRGTQPLLRAAGLAS